MAYVAYLFVLHGSFLTLLNFQWYPEIRHFFPQAQLVIVGTMTDRRLHYPRIEGQYTVVSAPENHNTISYEEGMRLAEELHASYVECSAKCDYQSVNRVLETMVWRWHEFGRQKKLHQGLDGCTLQ